jgi:serine/threonine-protein kinase
MTLPDSTPATTEFGLFAAALAGQYALVREIGRGGMGIVYLADDLKLDRRVAIKTLPPHLAGDPLVRERFLREARTAGSLTHPNIVPIHRADELSGHVFFDMGFVDGESLAAQMAERGRISAPDVVRILRDVADALAYAHARGLVHRDVKAENILIDAGSGRALVTDFGIARLAEATPLTSTGQVLGTVYYLSPEQVTGDHIDARSDIYALGVVGYFALSGRFPFNAELASAVLIAHVNNAAPALQEVAPDPPRPLTDIIDRCLAKDPAERFQDCLSLRSALDGVENLVLAETIEREAHTGRAAPQTLLTDTETRDILERAADLQAATGIMPRPAAIVGSRAHDRQATDTSGHRLGNVRDAAIEAGIASKYVDHALLEHGLTPSGAPAPAPLIVVDRSKPANAVIGSPVQLVFEIVLDGEMPPSEFDLLVDVIRQHAGESGQLGVVGRSFSWQSLPGRGRVGLNVTVLPRGGKTTIRVSESLKLAAGALYGGIMGGLTGVSMPIWAGVAVAMHSLVFAGAMWAGTIAFSYVTAHLSFGAVSAKRERQLRELIEALAVQARESIEAAEPTPGLPSGR